MSDVTITLPESVARYAATALEGSSDNGDQYCAKQIREALPPEYPEGTVAWVTDGTYRYLADFCKGKWRAGGTVVLHRTPIKVEPFRVLADDEIAVKRPEVTGDAMAGAAERLADLTGFTIIPEWLKYVAQRLYAEKK